MNRISLLFCAFAISAVNYASGLESEGIVGGDEASENQFPYQISLQGYDPHYDMQQIVCGGSIISEQFVLTAGHCVINDTAPGLKRYSFTVIAKTIDVKIRPVDVAVDKIYVFGYDSESLANDIAVLKLKTPLDLKKNNLRAVKLPSAEQTYAGVKAVASGYGSNKIDIQFDNEGNLIKFEDSSDGKLRYAVVNVYDNAECARLSSPHTFEEDKICGRVVQRNKNGKAEGICFGDSGGPLVYNDILIGIISTSPGCDETYKVSTYTRVSSYLSFIQNVMSGNIDDNVSEYKVPGN